MKPRKPKWDVPICPTVSDEYRKALEVALEAGNEWQAAKLAYRAGFITDTQFVLAYNLFKASQEEFDAAYTKESA